MCGGDVGGELSSIVDFSAVVQRWNASFVNVHNCIQSTVCLSFFWQGDIHLSAGAQEIVALKINKTAANKNTELTL